MFSKLPPGSGSNPSSIFGYNGPEGLARCKELMRTRWRILVPLSALFFILGVTGLLVKSEARPDIALLQHKFQEAVGAEFTASGLALSNVYLVELKSAGKAEFPDPLPTAKDISTQAPKAKESVAKTSQPGVAGGDSPTFLTTWRYALTPMNDGENSALWSVWEQKYPECLETFKLNKTCTRQSQLLLAVDQN